MEQKEREKIKDKRKTIDKKGKETFERKNNQNCFEGFQSSRKRKKKKKKKEKL